MIIVGEYAAEIIKLVLTMTFTGSVLAFFLFIIKPFIKDMLP